MVKRFHFVFLLALLSAGCVAPVRESRPVRIGPTPSETGVDLSGWSFVIDPGHGGPERGAPSAIERNAGEADLNLAVSLLLGGKLEEHGADVHYTRKADVAVGDTFTSLREELAARVEIANRIKPDLFLSVHHNSSHRNDYNHIEMYFKLFTSGPSREAAREILEEFGRLYPDFDSSLLAGNFAVLRGLDGEGILAECSYISDSRLAPSIETLTLLKKEAAAIFSGVSRYAAASLPSIEWTRETGLVSFSVRHHTPLTYVAWGEGEGIIDTAVLSRGSNGAPSYRFKADDSAVYWIEAVNAENRRAVARVIPRGRRSPPAVMIVPYNLDRPDYSVSTQKIVLADRKTPVASLIEIEELGPGCVIILERGDRRSITHYFRSSTGKKWAESLAPRVKATSVVRGSHYLLNHTSMPALVVRSPEISGSLIVEIEAWSREQFNLE